MSYKKRTILENRNKYILASMAMILLFVVSLAMQIIGFYVAFYYPLGGAVTVATGSFGLKVYSDARAFNDRDWREEKE